MALKAPQILNVTQWLQCQGMLQLKAVACRVSFPHMSIEESQCLGVFANPVER